MTSFSRTLVLLAACFALSACTGLQSDFETPTVGISSFRALPSQGMVPRFEIGLHIVNPNRTALKLDGIVYTVILEGHKVLTGVSADLPVIGAYSEGDVTLTATADLLSSVGLLTSLMQQPQETFSYELDARLDIGSLRPRIHIQDKGEISLVRTGG
jgi:LEA14-like dessication related protein